VKVYTFSALICRTIRRVLNKINHAALIAANSNDLESLFGDQIKLKWGNNLSIEMCAVVTRGRIVKSCEESRMKAKNETEAARARANAACLKGQAPGNEPKS